MKEQTLFWNGPDPLAACADRFDREAFEAESKARRDRLFRPHWQPLHALLKRLPAAEYCLDDFEAVSVGDRGELDTAQVQTLLQAAELLKPWRKGPFCLFGNDIDAEWRSNLKWERIAPHLGSLAGKRVCDVGCGNGYYLFRAIHREPAFILGLDPSEIFFHQFHLVQRFVCDPRLRFEMLGVEQLGLFPEFFDTILCLGIIYHQRDPPAMLRRLHGALRPDGLAVVESMGIPGDEAAELVPAGRYAKAKNVYHLPTAARLAEWMEAAGFADVHIVSSAPTTVEEQRATDWMTFESLADFLDPHDPARTVEGHPAPLRIAVTGRKA